MQLTTMNTIHNRHGLRNAIISGMTSLLWLHASAATFSLNPGADAFVTTGPTGNLKNNNYGGAGAVSVAAPNLSQGEFQSVLQFGPSGAHASFDGQHDDRQCGLHTAP